MEKFHFRRWKLDENLSIRKLLRRPTLEMFFEISSLLLCFRVENYFYSPENDKFLGSAWGNERSQ